MFLCINIIYNSKNIFPYIFYDMNQILKKSFDPAGLREKKKQDKAKRHV